MTHAEASMKTKQAMADSLKRYMEVKSLSKITISAICEDCGINRKTFYYHFKDIYDLLKWTLEQESLVVVNQLDVMVDYEKIVLTLLDYVDKNRALLVHAYSAIGKNGFGQFFSSSFERVSLDVIDSAAERQNVELSEEYKGFLCCFYSLNIVALLCQLKISAYSTSASRIAIILLLSSLWLSNSVSSLLLSLTKPVSTIHESSPFSSIFL